jgi:hypothetical protein
MARKKSFFSVGAIALFLVAAAYLAISTPAFSVSLNTFSGKYVGSYEYPNTTPPVSFNAIMVIENGRIIGMTREPKTFGEGDMPYLYADIVGTISSDGTVKFVKTYDGTGGQTHSVNYEGKMDFRSKTITGTWSISADWGGKFSMKKQ